MHRGLDCSVPCRRLCLIPFITSPESERDMLADFISAFKEGVREFKRRRFLRAQRNSINYRLPF
jgi:hypothetical protein